MIKNRTEWFLPMFLMLLVAGMHLWSNTLYYHNFLLVGSDGPYYPLQVRSLLENGRLGFPDMPLLFALEAMAAKALVLLDAASFENSILLATRYTVGFLSALAILPAYLIARELNGRPAQWSWPSYLVLLFSAINFSTFVSFPASLLQKNSFAVFWMFFFLYFALRLIKYGKRKDLYYSLAALLLSPLIGFEWASRLQQMAYIPLTVVFFIIFSTQTTPRVKLILSPVLGMAVLLSIAGLFMPRMECMSSQAYAELRDMKKVVPLGKDGLIVGRQDLRLLSSWEFGSKGIAEY